MRDRRILPYQSSCFETGEVRELNIHKDQMWLGGKCAFNRLSSGRSFEDFITAEPENRRKDTPQVFMVIDN